MEAASNVEEVEGTLYQIKQEEIIIEHEIDENTSGYYQYMNGQCAIPNGRSVRIP